MCYQPPKTDIVSHLSLLLRGDASRGPPAAGERHGHRGGAPGRGGARPPEPPATGEGAAAGVLPPPGRGAAAGGLPAGRGAAAGGALNGEGHALGRRPLAATFGRRPRAAWALPSPAGRAAPCCHARPSPAGHQGEERGRLSGEKEIRERERERRRGDERAR